MSDVDFPYQVDGRGRTAAADVDGHVRDLIEQVLLTAPGERVMRPDFGSGLLGMVFEPIGPEVAATMQYLVQASLQQWLADVIVVDSVQISADDGTLSVSVGYVVRRTRERSVVSVTAPGGAA